MLDTIRPTGRQKAACANQALTHDRNCPADGSNGIYRRGGASGPIAFERAAREWQVPLKIVRDSEAPARENYGASLILVRPDQHVAWASDTASDAVAIVQKVIGQ